MGREPWYDSDNPGRVVRGATWRGWVWVISAVIVIAVISAIGWGVKVATSGVRGAGDQAARNNSVDNRVYAQQHFQDLYAAIQSYGPKLKQAATDKAAHPDDSFWATNYTGLFNTCVDAVNQYNADSGKALFSDWKSAGLPQQVNADDACGTADQPTATPTK